MTGKLNEGADRAPRSGLPTGEGTSATNDVADPHPSNEEHYDREKRPGGANPPKGEDAGVEVHRHDDDTKPRTPNRAVGDEDPSYSPMTRRGADGRAHVVEEGRSHKLPPRLDQPGRLPGMRLPANPD